MKLTEGSASASNLFSRQSNILDRVSSFSPSAFTARQTQVDGLVEGFVGQATDWKSLAAMMAGGVAYRFGRIGVVGLGSGVYGTVIRAASVGLGLTAEVSAFEATHRSLHSENPNLWKWAGTGGLKQGFLQSLITFGTLKLGGKIAQGQNLILQHGTQDLAMVAGHQLVYRAGIGPKPEGSFAEQMIHAEATNLQLGAGMGLGHMLTGGRLHAMERGLDLSVQRGPVGAAPRGRPQLAGTHMGVPLQLQPAFATAGGTGTVERSSLPAALREDPAVFIKGADQGPRPPLGKAASGGAHRPRTYSELIQERLASLHPESIAEVQEILLREWEGWEGRNTLDGEARRRIEALLPHYARCALAHLGRETPTHLPFVPEVYEEVVRFYEIAVGEGDRSHLIRFLSTQEGRRRAGLGNEDTGTAALTLPGVDFKTVRVLMGETYTRWEGFLRSEAQALPLSSLERAQVIQRGLGLFHFYGSYLFGRSGEALRSCPTEALFDAELIQRTLDDASRHPYPPEVLALFERFFREMLEVDTSQTTVLRPREAASSTDTTAILSLQTLTSAALVYALPRPGETWSQHLTRRGVTRAQLDAGGLGVTGGTILGWGTRNSPGDVLDLLGIVTYLGMDPFDALRLTHPEQLCNFNPDAEGNIVIRFPTLMADLDYSHFGLGALLRALLQKTIALDMDLAIQWGVNESTVSEYRRGIVRKMQLSTLESLVDTLVPPDAAEARRTEMRNLLLFLRYRAYFDATLAIIDQDGNPLNRRPPASSPYRIVLVPHNEALRPLDMNRRIRFEREPFASAINGTVDLALSLLEQRAEEFRSLGYDQLLLPGETVPLPSFSERIRDYRDRHGECFQRLSRQERTPGVVRPGELRGIQDFYREFFRFFEAVHLHARPQGELRLGEIPIRFEVVPVTAEQPGGVRIVVADLESASGLRVYVVAADLFERTRDLSAQDQGRLLQIHVMTEVLQHLGLWVPASFDQPMDRLDPVNRAMLCRALERSGVEVSDEILERFQTLSGILGEGRTVTLDPSTEAVLHRITQGHLSQGARERRTYRWENDLGLYLAHHRLDSKLAAAVQEVFEAYHTRVPHPFSAFRPEGLEEALGPIRTGAGEIFAQEVRTHVIQFMGEIGLPTEAARPVADSRLTVEGLAQAAFPTYLRSFQSLHPLRLTEAILQDHALMERVIDDRLVDFPHLIPHRESVLNELQRRIADYNQRQRTPRVHELAGAAETTTQEPWTFSLLDLSFRAVLEDLRRDDREIETRLSRPLIQTALRDLRPRLAQGERPDQGEIRGALEGARTRLESVGIPAPEAVDRLQAALHRRFLENLVENLHPRIAAVRRLSALLPPFVIAARIRSGLEASPEIGNRAQEIFNRHLASALLDVNPLSLNKTILQGIGARFDPYSTIREDVLRGMRAIHREGLLHLLERYHEMEDAVEMARQDCQYRETERFWENFTALASVGDPALQTRGDLEARIADLEIFLGLFPFGPQNRLSHHLREAVAEIESLPERPPDPPKAPPPPPADPAPILAVPISGERLERCPELELVTDEEVIQQIHESQKGGRDLAKPEARELLQLLGLLERYGQALPEVELLTLEVRSSDESEPIRELTERAYRDYDVVRETVLSEIDPFDRVGLLPELRGDGPRRTGLEAGKAAQYFISRRQVPVDLDKALRTSLDEVSQSAETRTLLRSNEPEKREAVILTPYLTRVADLYLRNRDRITQASLIPFPEEYGHPLEPGAIPSSLRAKLEREAPELDLAPDELLFEILKRDPVPMEGRDYLFEKLHLFLDRHFKDLPTGSPAAEAVEAVNAVFDRIEVLMWAGAEYSPWIDHLMAVYRRHRPAFLAHLIETAGIEKVMAALPELRGEEVKPVVIPMEQGEVLVKRLGGFETAAKAANRMVRLDLTPRQHRNMEQVLWDFDPKEELFPKGEPVALTNLSPRIMRYYLNHREEWLGRPDRSRPETLGGELNRIFHPYWELGGEGNADTVKMITHIKRMIAFYNPQVAQHVLTAHRDGQRVVMVVTEENKKEMEAAWAKGKSFPAPGGTGKDIPKPDRYHFRPYDADLRMRYVREVLSSPRFFNLYSIVLNEHAKNLIPAVDRELDRATALLLLGVDEGYVIPAFTRRVLKIYEKDRKRILDEMEFGPYVWNLPEVAGLPSHVLDVQGGSREFEPVELFTRLAALMNHLDAGASNVLQAWEKQVGSGREDPKKNIERSARFYLQHREEILPHLKSWDKRLP